MNIAGKLPPRGLPGLTRSTLGSETVLSSLKKSCVLVAARINSLKVKEGCELVVFSKQGCLGQYEAFSGDHAWMEKITTLCVGNKTQLPAERDSANERLSGIRATVKYSEFTSKLTRIVRIAIK